MEEEELDATYEPWKPAPAEQPAVPEAPVRAELVPEEAAVPEAWPEDPVAERAEHAEAPAAGDLERRLADAEAKLEQMEELHRRVLDLEAKLQALLTTPPTTVASEVRAPFRITDHQGRTLFQADVGKLGPRVRLYSLTGEPVAVFYITGSTGALQLYKGPKRTVGLSAGDHGGEIQLYDAAGREVSWGMPPSGSGEGGGRSGDGTV